MHKALVMTALSTALLIGCANSDDTDDPITNSIGGNCGSAVISDYNSMIQDCRMAKTISACESSIESFLSKYPGIDCKAEKSDSYSFDDSQIVYVTESYVRSLLSSLKGGTSTPPPSTAETITYKYGEACSSVVIEHYNVDVALSCDEAAHEFSKDIKVYEKCSSGIDRFITRYPGVNCRHRDSRGNTAYMTEDKLLKAKSELDKIIELMKSETVPPRKSRTQPKSGDVVEI